MTIETYEDSSDPEMTPTSMPIYAGRFYMVMDNMGITLGNKMKQNVDIGLKMNYLRNLVDGLFIMHDKSFCHLDIKENNILIGKDNYKDCVQNSSLENLDFITAGPIPPNPSELIILILLRKRNYLIAQS
jgi:serine/threonine protein kinase